MNLVIRPVAAICAILVIGAASAAAVERPDPFPACYPSAPQRAAAEEALRAAADLLAEGKLKAAQAETCEASLLVPTAAAPHVLAGMIAEKQGTPARAIDEYREALAWDPDETRALAALERLSAPRSGDIVSQYVVQLIDLMNAERAARDLPPLKPHPVLAEVAYGHSCAMRDLGFFSHESPLPGQKTSVERFLRRFDSRPRLLGENVSRRWRRPERALGSENVARSHAELMMSTGHRRNILHPDAVYVGIGIAVNPEGDYWITQLFMTPRSASPTSVSRGGDTSGTAP
jgi:uncharacterized protein YkwD